MPRPDPEQREIDANAADAATTGGFVRTLTSRLKKLVVLDSRAKILGVAALASLGLVGLAWWTSREEGPTQREQLDQALTLIEDRANRDSRKEGKRIARNLYRQNFHPPDFPGGPEYVLGMVAFRDGLEAASFDRKKHFDRAVRFLRETERYALEAKYLPEWSYALGVSLFETGKALQALPLLEDAVAKYPSGRVEAGMRLAEVYLDRKREPEMRSGVALLERMIAAGDVKRRRRDRALLQLAMLHLALHQQSEARAALNRVSDVQTGTKATRVFRAQALIASANVLRSRRDVAVASAAFYAIVLGRARREYEAAKKELKPVVDSAGLDTTFSSQATWLYGLSSENVAELNATGETTKYDEAISYYDRTSRKFEDSHEAVIASLRAARLLRISGRHEEAVLAYRRALQPTGTLGEFHNRWIGLEEFRSILTQEWNAWMQRKAYEEAIELSRLMAPVFPPAHTQELNALAHREWAKALETQIRTKPGIDKAAAMTELRRRRRLTGTSLADLAELVRSTNRYTDVLWRSAGNYREGHDFENALKQYTAFINAQPEGKLPEAYVERGRVLMDLNRLKEAREHFQKVLDAHPRSNAAFEAKYLLAVCRLEAGEEGQAEELWRKTLSDPKLKPTAREWRLSLLALGRHLFHTARILREKSAAAREAGNAKVAGQQRDRAKARLAEAVLRLEEYRDRYSNSFNTTEARFLLAKALQERASIAAEQVREAEVENVRNQFRNRKRAFLRAAIAEYKTLQTALLGDEESAWLGDLRRTFLRDCYFEIAHANFALGEYRQAIRAYNAAANRYPDDPQILLAYLQMANSHNRLGDPAEAFSLIVQAEVIFRKLPDTSFRPPYTTLTKAEWKQMLQWARQQHLASRTQ